MDPHSDRSHGNRHQQYGAAMVPDEEPSRGLGDYVAMFRERIWLFLLIFIFVLAVDLLYTFTKTPVYQSAVLLEILRDDPDMLGFNEQGMDMQRVYSMEDFKTQVNKLESQTIIRSVAARLKGEELEQFLEPYEDMIHFMGPITPEKVLHSNRKILPIRQSLDVQVLYTHPDPKLASKIANLFAEEFVDRNHKLLVESSMDAVDALQARIEQAKENVQKFEDQLAEYSEGHATVSLDFRTDIDQQELLNLNQQLTNDKNALDTATTNWSLVQDYQKQGRDLWDLPFIGSMRQIDSLLSRYSSAKVDYATLQKRYRSKHPQMIQAQRVLDETQKELNAAITSAVGKIQAIYQTTKDNYEKTASRLKEQKAKITELSKLRSGYNVIKQNLETANVLYQGMLQKMSVEANQANMKKPSVRIVDKAFPATQPSSPKVFMNVAVGVVGGFGLGFAVVMLLGILDERVKTAMDIERELKLNLLGVIHKTSKMSSFDRARLAASNTDRRVAESFRSLYSAVRIQEVTYTNQVLMLTSTVPSEGKTFIATNLAITAASHGERTLLVDADLRMPAVAHSLGFDKQIKKMGGGLTGYLDCLVEWDQMIVSDIFPGLDLLASAQRSRNPSEMVNSQVFRDVISTMREYYDRIIIDTSPIGVVSDALAVSPIADGCIYVAKHNFVKIRNMRASIKKLNDADAPLLGVVMNNVNKGVANNYHNYHGRGYDSYYGEPIAPVKAPARADHS